MTDAEAVGPLAGKHGQRPARRGDAVALQDAERDPLGEDQPGTTGASGDGGLLLALRRLGEAFATFDAAVGRHATESGLCEETAGARLAAATQAHGDASR